MKPSLSENSNDIGEYLCFIRLKVGKKRKLIIDQNKSLKLNVINFFCFC